MVLIYYNNIYNYILLDIYLLFRIFGDNGVGHLFCFLLLLNYEGAPFQCDSKELRNADDRFGKSARITLALCQNGVYPQKCTFNILHRMRNIYENMGNGLSTSKCGVISNSFYLFWTKRLRCEVERSCLIYVHQFPD